MTAAVDAMIAAATPLVGLHYPDDAYAAAISVPADGPARAAQMARESGCALLWRSLVSQVYQVELVPYVDGSAFEVMWKLAGGSPWIHRDGAVRIPTLDAPPELGDAIVYDKGPGGPQHVDAVATGATMDGSYLRLRAIAGGQRLAGAEAILQVARALVWRAGRWLDTGTGRPVMACISPDGLATLHGLRT